MNIYRILKIFNKVKSTRIKLCGILCMHLLNKRYIGIFIDPVLACNFRCKMCYFSNEQKRKELSGSINYTDLNNIAKTFFNRAVKLQIGCGAEPTIYKNITEIIKLGKLYKIPYISITTNGKLLSYERLKELVEAGLDELTFSVHGLTSQNYNFFMPGGNFDSFLQLLEYIKKIHIIYPTFKVRINYTVNEDNINDLKMFWTIFENVPLNIVQIRPIQKIGESEYSNFSMEKIKYNYYDTIAPIIETCKTKNITCLAPTFENLNNLDNIKESELNKPNTIEEFTYCYISPQCYWKKDIDIINEDYNKYCKRTHFTKKLLKAIIFCKKENQGKRVTKKLNYKIN